MKICKFSHSSLHSPHVGFCVEEQVTPLAHISLFELLEASDVEAAIKGAEQMAALPLGEVQLLAPIDQQEVWAAGVTYKRSQTARMEESEAAASCYDRVYVAD